MMTLTPARSSSALIRPGAGCERSAHGGGALAHAGQAVAAVAVMAVAWGRAAAGIGDLDAELVAVIAERDRGGGRAGVPDGVGERLLDDAVGGQVHGGR